MGKYLMIAPLLILCCFCELRGQASPTRIVKFEVDGKEVKTSYNVYFLLNEDWVKAKQALGGFQLPDELSGKEWIDLSISFGKYQLDFSQIHISKFNTDWIVGIDIKPFSDEYVDAVDVKNTKLAWYIKFLGTERVTRVVVRSN